LVTGEFSVQHAAFTFRVGFVVQFVSIHRGLHDRPLDFMKQNINCKVK
jgi:hypothetical protein